MSDAQDATLTAGRPQSTPQTTQQARPWVLPTFDGPPTAASVERVEQQAWQEGDARGYRDGLTRGAAEIARRVKALDNLVAALATPLAEQDARIAGDLQNAAWSLAEVLAYGQLRHDPEAVSGLVHEAIKSLNYPAESLKIQVSPNQHDAIQAALEQSPPAQPWRLDADRGIADGDCKVACSQATADATLDTRVRALREQLIDLAGAPPPENCRAGSAR